MDQSRPEDPRALLPAPPGSERSQPGESSVEFPVSVVLPAGGSGERTGLTTPKQFCCLMGRPLISYTVQAFERVRWIQAVVVVVAKENLGLMTDIVQRYRHSKVRVVPGGSTRHRSISRGVEALGEERPQTSRPSVVIVHDAVRPFVEEELLFQITMAAKEHGAAGAIRPLVSTVIASTSEGFLDHSLERAKYRASEMPQAFTYEVISTAYQRCTDYDLDFGTECLHLALQYCGTNAKLIEGPPTLWKVTYKRDLAAAESIIKESLSQSCCCLTGSSPSAVTVASSLQKSFEALQTGLVVVPDLEGENSKHLLREWNFIQISVDGSVSEVKTLLRSLQSSDRALLSPVVVVWVSLSEDVSPLRETATDPAVMIKDLASDAKLENLLLYGVHVQLCQDPQLWQSSMSRLTEVTSALIQDRSPALVGQILQV